MKPNLSDIVVSRVKRISLILISLLGTLLFLITISRFSNMDNSNFDSVWTWMALYLGEGPVRFCQYIWDNTVYQNGDNTMSIVKEFLGIDTFTDMDQKRDYYALRSGLPTNIFYTMLGDIVYDFGLVTTAIISIIASFVLNLYCKYIIDRGYLTFSSTFLLGMIILLLEFGFMYFCFKQNNVQHLLLYNVGFVLLYKYINIKID